MGVAERRQRERQGRRAAIVEAARGVFLHKGLDGTTMDDIAKAAELSKGGLYLHFKSKDELYIEVLHHIICNVINKTRSPAAAPNATGIERLRAIHHKMLSFAQSEPDLFRLAMSWMMSRVRIDPSTASFQAYRERIAEHIGMTVAAIQAGQADGTIRDDLDAAQLAHNLWAAMVGVLLTGINRQAVMERLPVGFEPQPPEEFLEFLLRSVAPQGSAR